jgi:hypothetical protein
LCLIPQFLAELYSGLSTENIAEKRVSGEDLLRVDLNFIAFDDLESLAAQTYLLPVENSLSFF